MLKIFKRCRLLCLKFLSSVGDREISLYVIVHTFIHCLPPITVSGGDIPIRKATPGIVESESRY
jgi:hypothetical protein